MIYKRLSKNTAPLAAIYNEPMREAALRQTLLVELLCSATGATASTVRTWISGNRQPSKAAMKLIAGALNRPESELFPTKEDKDDDDKANNRKPRKAN